jgi:hypothetical protein
MKKGIALQPVFTRWDGMCRKADMHVLATVLKCTHCGFSVASSALETTTELIAVLSVRKIYA